MKKKKTDNFGNSIESLPKDLINIERADALTYVKIKHPLRKGVTVYVSNIELNLLIYYSIKANAKSTEDYSNFVDMMKLIDLKNELPVINYRKD